MEFKKIAMIHKGQDGAVWGGFLFRFDADGKCYVYDLTRAQNGEPMEPASEFWLGSCETVRPHSNSVTFSGMYFEDTDEFPLLFSNVYNNYAREENRREGMCCVYRLKRQGAIFSADLVATLEVEFTGDSTLWRSPNVEDIRPYGNFAVDRKNKKLYVFTMRDESHTTRYFRFPLPEIPKAHAGVQRILPGKRKWKISLIANTIILSRVPALRMVRSIRWKASRTVRKTRRRCASSPRSADSRRPVFSLLITAFPSNRS